MGLFTAGERRRRRSRRARSTVKAVAGERKRRSHRRRSARALFKGLAERKRRSRRARSTVKAVGERRRRRSRRARSTVKVMERKRRRRSRRARSTVVKMSERKRRRSRRGRKHARRSKAREVLGLVKAGYGLAERKRRRSRRARSTVKAVAGERRRRHGRRARSTFARFAPKPVFTKALERRRRHGRRARSTSMLGGVTRYMNGSFATYAKKAGVATAGILGGRLLSAALGKAGNAVGLWKNATLAQYSGVITSGVAGGLTYWLTGLKPMPALVKNNRGLITLGAYLHFVEEILNVAQGWGILPKSGVMAGALYGYPLGNNQAGGMGYCSYGCSIPSDPMISNTLQQPCIGPNGAPGAETVYQGVNGLGGQQQSNGMGYCSYGCSIPADPTNSNGWQPYTNCAPGQYSNGAPVVTAAPGTPASNIPSNLTVPVSGIGGAAFEQAGFAAHNPAVNDLLVGRANNIQSVLAGAGIAPQN